MVNNNVLICSTFFPPNNIGGAEIVAFSQAKELKKLGLNILIFSTYPKKDNQIVKIESYSIEGIQVIAIPLEHKSFDNRNVDIYYNEYVDHVFKKILKQFNPSVVHFHNLKGMSINIIPLAKKYGSKCIMTLHDYWGVCFGNTLRTPRGEVCNTDGLGCRFCSPELRDFDGNLLNPKVRSDYYNYCFGFIDKFISPSYYLKVKYVERGFPQDKISIIEYGIDTLRFKKVLNNRIIDREKLRLVFVGFMSDHKGIRILIDALNFLDKKKIFIRFAGSGPELDNYKKLISDKGWDGSVMFLGKIDNSKIEEVYLKSDLMISPSIWPENLPVTINEALACGIPVVGSQIGGIPQLVKHGKNGFLFSAGDSFELSKHINTFINSPDLLTTMSKQARKSSLKRSYKKIIHRIHNLYNNL